MKIKNLFSSLIFASVVLLSSCSKSKPIEIKLDDNVPTAYVGFKYDFTDVLFVEEGVNYSLEVYYQNYVTMEEKSIPVVDTFYFTPLEPYDATVIVSASRGNQTAKRITHVPVIRKLPDPEEATRNNIEMCHFEPGAYRGTGSKAEMWYDDTYGEGSTTSRKVTFKNSEDLPNEVNNEDYRTVNASFNLANTQSIGTENQINAKFCVLSFDVKLSEEFFKTTHTSKYFYSLKIEDETWWPKSATLSLVDNPSDFDISKTDNGWLHVEQDLSEVGDLEDLNDSTYVITFGFFGITNAAKQTASIIFDNISLTDLPDDQRGERELATRNNLEMCSFMSDEYRGAGSKGKLSFTETYGATSTSSRKVTFENSYTIIQDGQQVIHNPLPAEVDNYNFSTVNASFNLAVTKNIGQENNIDAKNCVLSFDIKLSEEFYNTTHASKHLFNLKIESPVENSDQWITCKTDANLVDNPSDFDISKTDNGWLHVEQELCDFGGLVNLGVHTYVITFGFYGITSVTQATANLVMDNIALIAIPAEREVATRNNIEMCHFEPGAYRGTGSKAVISYDETYGSISTSSRKVTFENSEDLPNVVDDSNFATVNASFNLANTSSIGENNGINAKNCILSFDIKLSEEFFNSGHLYKHMFSLKIEDESWATKLTWISFVNNVSDFTYENTDNGWIHFEYDMSLNSELAGLGSSTNVMTFGFFGITNTTRQTATVVFDNIKLAAK